MKSKSRKLRFQLSSLKHDSGQNLVEYALVVAMVAFGATAGLTSVATAVGNVFSAIDTALSSAMS